MQERRKHPRIPKNLPIKLLSKDSSLIVTKTKNISLSGAYCHTSSYFSPMTILDITMLLHTQKSNTNNSSQRAEKVHCRGVVVRSEKIRDNNYAIAIFFNEIAKKEKEKLERFIEQHKQVR